MAHKPQNSPVEPQTHQGWYKNHNTQRKPLRRANLSTCYRVLIFFVSIWELFPSGIYL